MSAPQARELKLDAFLPYRLALAANAVSRLVARRYEARFGLGIPEWRLIAVLGEERDGLAQSALPAKTGMDKVAVSRAAARLTARELLGAQRRKGDSRARVLALTPMGLEVYREIAPLALDVEARLSLALGGVEREAAIALLRRLEGLALDLAAAD